MNLKTAKPIPSDRAGKKTTPTILRGLSEISKLKIGLVFSGNKRKNAGGSQATTNEKVLP